MTKATSDILQLCIAQTLKLAMDAAKQGVAIRSLILSALVAAGYDNPKEEIRDKRKGRA